MPRKRVRCANRRCPEFLTERQRKAGGKYHSLPCARADGRYKRFNIDPEFIETSRQPRRNEEW